MKRFARAFSLVELVIVIAIIVTLSSIGMVSYSDSLLSARNAARTSDMGALKISLQNHKFKNSLFPIPGQYFNITNSGVIITQGFINQGLYSQEIIDPPKDPKVPEQYYLYSVNSTRLLYQIGMTMESSDGPYAFVDGNYQQILYEVPSLLFASSTGGTLSSLSSSFITNGSLLNYPYNKNGQVVKNATNFGQVISTSSGQIQKFYGNFSCKDIFESGYSFGSGTYFMLDVNNNATQSGCTMQY